MVDIHSHILPGLDDGARSMEEALSMARMAAEVGFNHIVTSSHGNCFPYRLEAYWEQFQNLQGELRRHKIPVTLYPGMEIYLDADAKRRLENRELLSINHTRYLLVEFPMEELPRNICRRIGEMKKRNYTIVVAHPERYRAVQKEPELIYYLKEEGCLLQMNANSPLGQFGSESQHLSRQMLRDGIIDVIGTDAHDGMHRTPSIRRALEYLRQVCPSTWVHLWLSENPSRILKGYPIIDTARYRAKE